ncbi:MAG: hypothetical protein A3C61_01390 [Candidatus Yanofskybacteria bacterium RIFCSPHIGHO2_02_FULL_39_10]|uniref:DNA primase n=1 Tax=Candidatus Yanofskybacteria bacterium RIFCSPHIGHO2_02_FULL_39_10 TaxID=1802674 RepID=A0A1F8F6B3_9BACT|nr:MAG: hypothetical protein A3C61_01390 [Candidatus Yanofskybacteria bacterium RIFCSPHIGHO2_02_FULL_39_10]
MPEDNVSKIKERLDITDIISSYIKVQKAGVNFKACCPFHNEKTPSFYISPERQIWHCFGCQKGGDMFSFVQELEGVEFPEALRVLAQRAGVKLDNFDPTLRDAKTALYEIIETASRFFEKQLSHSPAGKQALVYLRDRGLKEDTIKEFRLGFAPDDWHSLGNFLRNCGYSDQDIISSGLTIKRDGGADMYDRFRSRIIFPICNINDQIVGFTGRVFQPQTHAEKTQNIAEKVGVSQREVSDSQQQAPAKYINTPQTAIYDKGRILYGLNRAKMEARRANRCLLVEGNMDAIMSYQAGVKNVAATSGTALTPSQLQLLQRYTNNLDFCFDVDQAGFTATRRGIGLALSQNFNIKIVHLQDPQCKDPADYVKKFGQKWQETVISAKPVIDFYFDRLKSELDLSSVEGKKALIANLGPLIKRLVSNVEHSHWVSKLAAVLKTKEEAIEADILLVKDDLEIYAGQPASPNQGEQSESVIRNQLPINKLADDMLSEALLAVLIKNPKLLRQQAEELNLELMDPSTNQIISKLIKSNAENFKFDNFIKQFNGDTVMKLEFAYLKSQELLKDFTDKELEDELLNIKNKLEHRSLVGQLASIELDIKAAEANNDKEKLALLASQFNELTKKFPK